MSTIVIQIGNSDDKLSQAEWSNFVGTVHQNILDSQVPIHFFGLSAGDALWQNACWVIESLRPNDLRYRLHVVAARFQQDSIAFTTGATEFLEATTELRALYATHKPALTRMEEYAQSLSNEVVRLRAQVAAITPETDAAKAEADQIRAQ